MNRQVSSSTLAFNIRKRSWFFVKVRSNVLISSFNVLRQAISAGWRGLAPDDVRVVTKCVHGFCLDTITMHLA